MPLWLAYQNSIPHVQALAFSLTIVHIIPLH